jgi:AcrR family transcriptional regulator
MARSGADTRRSIVEAAYDMFYRDGFGRVGVDAVAEAAGITKRTLYYHFDSKDTLLAAVLDRQHELAIQRIEGWAGDGSGTPGEMLDDLFDALGAWASGPNWAGSGFTRIAMELAGQPGHPARRVARNHKAAVEANLAARLEDRGLQPAGEVARQVMLLLEGCQAMTLISGDLSYIHVAASAARRLVAGR